jgi:lipoprotein LprG
MGSVDTVRFGMLHSGAPVYIDPANVVSFKEADGRFVAPASADAILTVGAVGLTVQIGAVAIDGETCLSNFITGEFEPAPAGYTFDPATLFDPDLGWRPLLTDGLTDVVFVGEDEVADRPVYHLSGLAAQDRVELITAGLVRGQDVVLELWIDRETGHVLAAEFDAEYRGEATNWRLTFGEYGEDMNVSAPESCDGG